MGLRQLCTQSRQVLPVIVAATSAVHLSVPALPHAARERKLSAVRGRAAQEDRPSGPSMNPAEVAKFQKLAREWWDPAGSSAALHALNPVRTKFTRDALCHCYGCAACMLRIVRATCHAYPIMRADCSECHSE